MGDSKRRRITILKSGKNELDKTTPYRSRHSAWPSLSPPRGINANHTRPSGDIEHSPRRRLLAANRRLRVPANGGGAGELYGGDGRVLLRGGVDGAVDGEVRHGGDGGGGEEGGEGRGGGESVG